MAPRRSIQQESSVRCAAWLAWLLPPLFVGSSLFALASRRLLPATDYTIDADLLALPSKTHLADTLGLESPAEPNERRLADQNANGSRIGIGREQLFIEALEPRSGVDRVSFDDILRPLSAAQRSGNCRARENPNPCPGSCSAFGPPAHVQLVQSHLHRQLALHGAPRVLVDFRLRLERNGNAEVDDNPVTGILTDDAAIAAHHL